MSCSSVRTFDTGWSRSTSRIALRIGSANRQRSDTSAHDQAAIADVWKVNLVGAIIEESGQLNVAHHADDLEFFLVLVELHVFSNRVFVGKYPSGEGLAADHDGRCIGGVVGSRESPPSQQGYAERTEVVPRHSLIFDAVALFRLVLAAHNPHSAFVHLNALHGPVPRIACSCPLLEWLRFDRPPSAQTPSLS